MAWLSRTGIDLRCAREDGPIPAPRAKLREVFAAQFIRQLTQKVNKFADPATILPPFII